MKKLSNNKIGKSEISAALKVLRSGVLSNFTATNNKNFNGGKYVQQFEKNLSKFYNYKIAILVNSRTSGLVEIFVFLVV